MTPEIERLLGGYATHTLTEAERKLLYEAALEDQKLFDALEDEQALRDLLADEESRREIGRALRPSPAKPNRLWIWGLAAGVAAAVVLVIMLVPRNRRPLELAYAPSPSRVAIESAPARPIKIAPLRKKAGVNSQNQPVEAEVQAAAPALPAPAPPAATIATTDTLARLERQLGGAPGAKAVFGNQFRPMAAALGQVASPAPFLILRAHGDTAATELNLSDRIQAGDSIQLKLRPSLSGSLALSELTASGSWKSLPADAIIPVDRQKIVRVEWLSPPATKPLTTLLTLSPGQPPVTQQQP